MCRRACDLVLNVRNVRNDLMRVRITRFGHLCGRAANDRIEAQVAMGNLRRGPWIIGWQLAGEEFVEQDADRENVGAVVNRFRIVDHFGRGVAGGAVNFRAFLMAGADRMGQAEIANFRLILQIEQDVRRFDVAVDDAVFMGMRQTAANGRNEAYHLLGIDCTSVRAVEKRLARHELHDDEEHAIHFAEVIDADEVRVVEPCHAFGFGFEDRAEARILAEFLGQDFDGDRSVERFLHGAIDRAHATRGDEALDVVGGKQWRQLIDFRCLENDLG